MDDRRLAPTATVAGVICCVGTTVGVVALGGVALASLGQFWLISGVLMAVVIAAAWTIDRRRQSSTGDEHDPVPTP